jgi:CrcB protein
MKTILAVMLGGGLGAGMRYGVNMSAVKLLGAGFPWATLFVNISGSLVIGILTGIFALTWQPSPEMKAFLITGILGGYTTFSAFSLDTVTLWEGGAGTTALIYIIVSFACSIAALFIGLTAVRMLTA